MTRRRPREDDGGAAQGGYCIVEDDSCIVGPKPGFGSGFQNRGYPDSGFVTLL